MFLKWRIVDGTKMAKFGFSSFIQKSFISFEFFEFKNIGLDEKVLLQTFFDEIYF